MQGFVKAYGEEIHGKNNGGHKSGLTSALGRLYNNRNRIKSCDEDGQGCGPHREPACGESRWIQPDAYPFRAEKANAGNSK